MMPDEFDIFPAPSAAAPADGVPGPSFSAWPAASTDEFAAFPSAQEYAASNAFPNATFNKDAFAAKFTGPLAGKADLIEQKSQQYGVPPALASAIIAQETGYGKAIQGNNVGGMMQGGGSQKMQFSSVDEGLDRAIRNIARLYNKNGQNLEKLRDDYAPIDAKNDPKGLNKDWLPGVSKIMGMFQP